jgi:hypothetical protein
MPIATTVRAMVTDVVTDAITAGAMGRDQATNKGRVTDAVISRNLEKTAAVTPVWARADHATAVMARVVALVTARVTTAVPASV